LKSGRRRSASTSESKAWNRPYGAAASIVVVLIWVYYTSQIILMGAEITHSYAKHNGSLKRGDLRAAERAGDPGELPRPTTSGVRNKKSSTIPV
jgi:membrane protein